MQKWNDKVIESLPSPNEGRVGGRSKASVVLLTTAAATSGADTSPR